MRTLLAGIILLSTLHLSPGHADTSRPNIIFILVDDMGFSDIGCYGGEVRTPNIDHLAQNGLRFTSMYNTSKCFPSRACLLTGVYAQQCGMGRRPQEIKNAITMAELLKTAGYRTLAVGKHHSKKSLYERGFDRFYGFHYGEGQSCANHFNPGEQRSGEPSPARKKGETRTYCFDDQKMIPYYTPKEKDWYTTDSFTNWAIDFLEEYKHEDKPYFLYLSYTAPHDPLHAWPEDIARYDGFYEAGYESIRQARFERQMELGLMPQSTQLSQATHRPWSSLNAAEQKDQARRMQVYAAMIDRVDQNIGKLRTKINELGEEENTLILFASDNGCSAENVDTGFGEVGSISRWASLQRDWANVSNTPFRYWKNLSHEGGIRTPFIAYWPNGIRNPGTINDQPAHFVDVMATVRDITDASYPRTLHGQPVTALQGESLLPALSGDVLPPRKNPIYFEFSRGGAVRDSEWKLVSKTLPKNKVKPENEIPWELYKLSRDVTETQDLADEHPDIVRRLSRNWQSWYRTAYGF